MVYGLHCYVMIALFVLNQRSRRDEIETEITDFNDNRDPDDYPFVTVQLPIYNEAEVAERLLRSAAALDYPASRFDIQVLDDSTDDTLALIDRVISELRSGGTDIYAFRREDRKDFKAGALANGLLKSKGEYLAIFDSDFVVPRNFLRRSVALIHDHDDVACVQARWGHNNRKENWITRAQSIGIDGHFTAEQGARGYSNLCLNFNGTAGIWRKGAIDTAGGWSGDTLTEDLDLSYRAQLCGYRIRYDFDSECPAEIPNNVVALKSQQKRWAKGSIETALKLLPLIFANRRYSVLQKIEAFLHLTHYFVAVLMCALFCLTLPMLLWTPMPKLGGLLPILWIIIMFSAAAPCVMYTASGWILRRGLFSLSHFPLMLLVGTGLCINNARAVFEALLRQKSDFIRTPKSGSTSSTSKSGRYRVASSCLQGYLELVSGLYCVVTLVVYLNASKFIFGFFIVAYALGLTIFGLLTLKDHYTISPSTID